jgi:hypothetical protein
MEMDHARIRFAVRPDLTSSEEAMNSDQFKLSLGNDAPDDKLPAPLAALWWDAKGDWARAHALVDELETNEGMAVHAYLHRKEGSDWNADYWYRRSGRDFHRPTLDAEWAALVEGLLKRPEPI